MQRPQKVWGISGVHSPPVAGGEKPVKAVGIFTHSLAAVAAAISILIASPQRFFSRWFAG